MAHKSHGANRKHGRETLPCNQKNQTHEASRQEHAMGTRSRSCGQWDVWEAVLSPACPDGLPCRLYDKLFFFVLNLIILMYDALLGTMALRPAHW